jgi:Cu/Zn superoxide dismutase
MRGLALSLILATTAACSGSVTSPPPGEWTATLAPTAGFPGVSGTATATTTATQTTVTATLSGAAPGSVHPWHIHFGTCVNDQGIVGGAAAYPHLEVDAAGNATATATINFRLQPGTPYMVNVHASPQDLPTIVACGGLTLQ